MPDPIIVQGPSDVTVVTLSSEKDCDASAEGRTIQLTPKNNTKFTSIAVTIDGEPVNGQSPFEIKQDKKWRVEISIS